jgi:uncharacterized protein DUF3455
VLFGAQATQEMKRMKKMDGPRKQTFRITSGLRFPARTATVLLGAAVSAMASSSASAQTPLTPAAITPPRGNVLFLEAHAKGTQNYICEPSTNNSGNSWVFFSPQATLSLDFLGSEQQVITHFLSLIPNPNSEPASGCTLSTETGGISCPTWQSSQDSSRVWGGKVGSINAGTDASCSNAGSIPCLLLKAVATDSEQDRFGILSQTTFIQRLNTNGGSAPATGCNVGDQALVPYSADYFFYKKDPLDLLGHDQGGHQ